MYQKYRRGYLVFIWEMVLGNSWGGNSSTMGAVIGSEDGIAAGLLSEVVIISTLNVSDPHP